MRLPLALLLLAACTGSDDKPADTDADDTAADTDTVDTDDTDTDTDTDTDVDPGAPSAPVVAITPAAPPAGVDFAVVVVTPSEDPEGDLVGYRYAWTEDGAARADLVGENVSGAETADGETWTVTVTPTDGVLDGPPGVATVTIGNTAPSAFGVTFSPAAPVDDEDIVLVLDPAPVDPDGDALTTSVTWYEDGSLNTVHQDKTTIEARYVSGGEVFRAVVSVTDGYNAAVVAEGTVTVANNPPEITSVVLSTESPADNDDIEVTARGTDEDGATVSFSYQWFRNGVAATDVGDTAIVPASATEVGDEWYVVVTGSDGSDTVSEDSNVATVIPFVGAMYTSTFTARISPDGTTGTGSWAYDYLSYGGRYGTNVCELEWTVALTDNPRACPDCTYTFDATYTYDAAASTTTTAGSTCTSFAADGTGSVTYGGRRADFTMTARDRSYYMYESMYITGSGTRSYSGAYSSSYYAYGVESETDTAGYTTITATDYARRYTYY